MDDFETELVAEVRASDTSLQQLRKDIEGAVDEIPVDVQADTSPGAGGASEIAARDRAVATAALE